MRQVLQTIGLLGIADAYLEALRDLGGGLPLRTWGVFAWIGR